MNSTDSVQAAAAQAIAEANRALQQRKAPEREKYLLAEIMEAKLDEDGEQAVRTVLRMLSENHGCSTPWEEFVIGLLDSASRRALTPDEVSDRVDGFRDNFESGIRDAALVLRDYPAEMKAELAELLAAQ